MTDAVAVITPTAGAGLALRGRVTADNAVSLRRDGEQKIASLGKVIEVDLSQVAEAHSILLSLLLCWQRAAHQQGKTITFTGAGDRLHALSALSGLDENLSGF
ncbi:STAS domain-containing protein [Marinobacter caseinilyticus]|uniref:STAS domain-containing protein n=1 Tax=Marinobacter caseinilyticus TaxID=2692195 RepID=UPI00140CC3CA|nr:STAS domain-containing protein [Marinobacter caseinilyticus]